MNENVSPIIARKEALRQQMRARRNALSHEERVLASQKIGEQLRALIPASARTIAVYLATKNEAAIDDAIQSLIDDEAFAERLIVAPRAGVRPRFGALLSLHDLKNNARGLRLPDGETVVAPWQCDVIVVPAMAFDARGGRLGQGGGWYDRALERARAKREVAPLVIGVGFACQIVDEVPQTAHDQRVDFMVTEDRVLDCRGLDCGRKDDN